MVSWLPIDGLILNILKFSYSTHWGCLVAYVFIFYCQSNHRRLQAMKKWPVKFLQPRKQMLKRTEKPVTCRKKKKGPLNLKSCLLI